MNIVFLDFDGVLTSCSETPGSYLTNGSKDYGMSKSCVERLKSFCTETNSKIIISSNWRRFPEDGPCSFWTHHGLMKTVKNPLKSVYLEFGELVIGTLPLDRHISKAEALILWFNQNKNKDVKFVIFDDDLSEGYQVTSEYNIKDHFVLTSVETGLSDTDIEKAKNILRK